MSSPICSKTPPNPFNPALILASPHTPVTNSSKAKYVHRLDKAGGIRRELASVYADARRGLIDSADAYRLASILHMLAKVIETSELADELQALEAATDPKALRRIA